MAKCRTKVYCNVGTLLFVYSLQTEEKYGNKERKLKYILFQMKIRIDFKYLYIFKPTTNEAISLYVRFFFYLFEHGRVGIIVIIEKNNIH